MRCAPTKIGKSMNGESETLAVRIVQTDVTHLQGLKFQFEISRKSKPRKQFKVHRSFTVAGLDLVEQIYPVQIATCEEHH